MNDSKNIRNFALIAHIDHGKSTLADRILETTGAISEREKKDQYLDTMELERERGITIKAVAVRLKYRQGNQEEYILNLIDTPGHVDFSYEVSRSLAACEGAVLLVDATQGVEAQTVANAYLAIENNLEIIPVINKIDLPNAEPERVCKEIEEIIGIDATDAIMVSAKTGENVDLLLQSIVNRIPPPSPSGGGTLKALIFDSWYDQYLGVVIMVRIFDGRIKVGDRIMFLSNGAVHEVQQIGFFTPEPVKREFLEAGEVGFVVANIKNPGEVNLGDTVTLENTPTEKPLPGFKELKPMVFAGIYPQDPDDYENLRDSLVKLRLNDPAFTFEPETSVALGFGFRCGFLGLLHMEIVQERLEREYNLQLVVTTPNVKYRVTVKDGETIEVSNPIEVPHYSKIETIEEPYVLASMICPPDYVGKVIELCQNRRGIQKDIKYPSAYAAIIEYEIPLAEIIIDFFNELKSVTRGFGSLDYDFIGYKKGDLVKLEIMINQKPVDAFTFIVPRQKAYYRARDMARKLKEVIPRQLFEVAIQASIHGRIIARESIRPLRKDVTAKCYGGDVTRKRKLLEKQKEGKRRMKKIGKIDVPQEAFMSILKVK